jgi:hypothetical protein
MSFYWPRITVYPLLVIILCSLFFAGCAGMQPYEPRNNREEGPKNGLFSGSQGEFVILRKAETEKQDQAGEKTDSPDE